MEEDMTQKPTVWVQGGGGEVGGVGPEPSHMVNDSTNQTYVLQPYKFWTQRLEWASGVVGHINVPGN